VLTLYGTEIWHYRRRRPIDPFTRAYTGAARVTFYSQGLLDRARALGLGRDGLSVIYPPVADDFHPRDTDARSAARRHLGIAEPLMILNVKRLHPLAGQRFLLDAFARVCAMRSDVRLVICGDGAEREPLTRQADALGVAPRVTFTGLIPNAVVAEYMAAADVFALPSLLEALPTVAVEALASGTPVVSADHPGGVELHAMFGDDLLVVPREKIEPLADALAARLASPRRTTPETTRQLDGHFRPAAVVDAFADVYRQVARPRA
jgi:Glycosyltransferase